MPNATADAQQALAPTRRVALRAASTPSREKQSAPPRIETFVSLLLCADRTRRQQFAELIESAGWRPIACDSIVAAKTAANRWNTPLAIVDLGEMPAGEKASFLTFAERFSAGQCLLMVSDEPDAQFAEAEILARRLGAWVYLPGPAFGEGIRSLLIEAKEIVEKSRGGDLACSS